jgi:hypothetical protein
MVGPTESAWGGNVIVSQFLDRPFRAYLPAQYLNCPSADLTHIMANQKLLANTILHHPLADLILGHGTILNA